MDWSVDPIFGSYAIVLLAGVGMLVVLLLVRESAKATRRQLFVLWMLRLLICLFVLLTMLRPGLTFTRQQTPKGSIAVMIDASASMQLASGERNKSRWEYEQEIWQSLWRQRELLGQDSVLIPFVYDSTLRQVGEVQSGMVGDTAPPLPSRPEGVTTDIGGPLNQVMSAPMSSPLSGIVWMGDGAQTHTPAGADAQQMARQLARLDIPMYVIGIGPRTDSESAKDLAVESLPEQLDSFTKSALRISGILRARGAANRDIPIRMYLLQSGGKPRLIDQTKVRVTKGEQRLAFQLSLIAPEAGSYELLIRADPLDGEAITENNEGTVFLNVRGGGARVLYIEGEARHESTYLRRAIGDSPDLQMDRQMIEKPPRQAWPVDLSERLADGVYDCFVLGDIDYDAIGPVGAQSIADQVKKGAGLVTLGGYHAYGPGGWDQSPLREVLPINMSGTKRQRINVPEIDRSNHYTGPVPLTPRGNHPLLQLTTAEKNGELWKQLRPLKGANKWSGVKNTPGTNVIAEGPGGEPMIVVGAYDQGRVVSLAVDTTYLWQRQGKVAEHKQFWRQMLFWCLRREKIEEGMTLKMTQRTLYLPQSAEMQLHWNRGSDEAEMPENISLHLWKTSGPKNPKQEEPAQAQDLGAVTLSKRDANSMRAQFAGSKESGRYEWRATAIGSKGQQVEAKLPFVVTDQSLESMQPLPDWKLIELLAKLNEPAGGMMLVPEQTDDIIRQILERRRAATQTSVETRKLGDGVLDTWAAFLLIGGILSLQWTLRKRWSLP